MALQSEATILAEQPAVPKPEIDLPALKDKLWQKMQGDLAEFVPEVVDLDKLMCCACGRFLPKEDFDVEHMIPKQAIKCDPEKVRSNPETPANVRAGTILLCIKPLHYRNSRFYNNGCNSWKGKHYDSSLSQIFTGKIAQPQNTKAKNAHIIGGLSLAYLAMVAEFGYIVALMPSGRLLREQFFTPSKFVKGLGTKYQAIFTGAPHTDPNDPVWANPFAFHFEDQSCLVTVRNFTIFLPVTRDPREPIARHLKIVPHKYAFRPNFQTAFT
jgi:hypothetical protein